jgi:hypothetical protein
MKSEAQVEGTTIEIDTEGMEKRLTADIDAKMSKYMEQLKSFQAEKEKSNGKGVVEAFKPEAKTIILEELHKGEQGDYKKVKEQWTICVPYYASRELAGHLRDFIWVTDAVKGKAGETVNVPYVKDIEFEHVTAKTGTFTAKTGLINVQTTTLHESGAYYDAYYGDIEKIDSNMLDELNRVFAHAAIRAEDRDLIDLLAVPTTADFCSPGATTRAGFTDIIGDTNSAFQSHWIADGLGLLMKRGKEVRPGECILIIGASNYAALLKELADSTPAAYARSDIIQQGMLEDYLGVKIVPVGYEPFETASAGGPTTVGCVYLIRPKRALALAPKRDVLIETDKLIATRQLRIAGSHTYGVLSLDESEIVRFRTMYGDIQPTAHA